MVTMAAANVGGTTPRRSLGRRRQCTAQILRHGGRVAKAPVHCHANARTVNVDADTWPSEVEQADRPVLVDFWADWCGPCKLIAPAIEEIAQEYGGVMKVVKLDTDANPNVAEQCGVYGLPTLAIFHDGQMIQGAKREGAISKEKIKQWLSEHGIEP